MEHVVIGVLSEEFRVVIEFAGETESELKKNELNPSEDADGLDRIEDVRYKCGHWFMAEMALTEAVPQDVVKGVEADNGAVAWRTLVKRCDPVVAGRNRSSLKIIITPERC